MKQIFLALIFCCTVISCSRETLAMSKTISFFSGVGSKIGSLFGKGRSSASSCTNCEASYEGPKPPVGAALPVWQYHSKGGLWTGYTMQAIDREGLAHFEPKDAHVYCPSFKTLNYEQRKTFWLCFASKLAEQESAFRSTQSFAETVGASKGSSSNGLFSMSIGDCSNLRTHSDTINDKKNIDCAIWKMKQLLNSKGGYIGTGNNRGLGYNWQPLNDYPKHYVSQTLANKKSMLNYTRSLPFCRPSASATFREDFGVNSNELFSIAKGDSCGILKTEADLE
ncbi:MAG: hypothetical protein OM95_07975 [Bdellovibrio sp. ArHS]|uniref:hypothetical protein n=1 Tax=Bdellovibrio sp. ArHS TaxID=1569284 RepID=UPI00058381F4|nr:hypothetical protein [Bdellovibrio sp. ArHS]KHD88723.1 MAG: hypothetical protein OM95_07975 [Bdellovibrio sp. ArHS]